MWLLDHRDDLKNDCMKFIYKNYYKMRTTGNSNSILGLTESVKNIVSKNYTNLPVFFEL